jgi:hypothetical protein
LRNFQHQGLTGVIANGFGAVGKTQSVTIVASDVGFSTDANCGTWARVSADRLEAPEPPEQSLAHIERNHALHERTVRNYQVR